MTNEKENQPNLVNFKKLYQKKYDDIVSKTSKMTPDQVFDLAVRYFSWAEENAIQAAESASYQGVITQHGITRPRVFTIIGLCLFCGISARSFENLRKDPIFADVTEFIDSVIREQKFQLAANNMVNSSLIIKDLGLDKGAQITVTSSSNANAAVSEEKMVEAVRSVLGEL